MCQLEALLTTNYNDENKYNTKLKDRVLDAIFPLYRQDFLLIVSKSCAKRVMEIKLCMCG